MVFIDCAIHAFLVIVPIWLLTSFVLFVVEQERSKSATPTDSANLSVSQSETRSDPSVPRVERDRLTVWSRRGEQVVPVESLNCFIPVRVQQFRWRKADVVRLADLEQVVAIV